MLVAGAFLFLFLMAVRKGQYDDDYTPSVRMLFDDGAEGINKSEKNHLNTKS